MAVQFILGRAGTGKSTYCLRSMTDQLIEHPGGKPLILLVPEQATFQAEYALASSPELGGTMRAQVLSFRRLALRIMQEVGGMARLPIDDTGKRLLLHHILHKHRERLKLFQSSADQMGFIEKLADLFNEFKRHCVTSEGLAVFVSGTSGNGQASPMLADKLHDLQLVYGEFEAELSRAYLDGEDYLTLLADQLPLSQYVKGAVCWIDGFHGFTPQEMAAIEGLAAACSDVKITLTLDKAYKLGDKLQELDLFHRTARTMLKLQERLEHLGLPEQETIVLPSQPPFRFENSPMLAYMEKSFEQRLKSPYVSSGNYGHTQNVSTDTKTQQLQLSAAVNRRAEVEGVARDILRLVRENGLRYRDIAVTLRNTEAYGELLAGTFDDCGIPHFFDSKRTVMHHPLVELIRSSMEVILHYWRYDAVFRCVKTGFFLPIEGSSEQLDRNELDQLENYVLAFGIQGAKWFDGKPWTYSLRSSVEQPDVITTDREADRLHKINACRRMVAEPLHAFQERMKKAVQITDKVTALYQLLIDLHVPERLESWSQSALQEGNPEKAREHAQIWERIIDMLDQMVELLQHEELSADTFASLLEAGMESIRLGHVPPSLDQVLIGSMDRTRAGAVKHVFVLGVNEGVMPAKISENGVLSEHEREALTDQGLMMADSARRKLLDEMFMIYSTFCTPSSCLWLSYPLADEEGKTLLPSEIIRQMKRMFPFVGERLLVMEPVGTMSLKEQLEYVEHPSKALSYLLAKLKSWLNGEPMSAVWWAVYNWLIEQPEWGGRLKALMQSLQFTNEAKTLSPSTSRLLYGEHILSSVSRMERFVACPFSQFTSHGLKLQERRIHRLESPDIGQLFHAALSSFASEVASQGSDWGKLSPQDCMNLAGNVVDLLAPRLQSEILLSSNRHHYIARKLKQVVGRAAMMLGEHARRGKFQPVGLEIGFGTGQTIPPLSYMLENGIRMDVRGRIDRVDRADTEQGTLLRVIDYKSSPTALLLSEVYYGLSLQMLTYLDVILTHSKAWLGIEAKPAGVLYFHVHNPLLQLKNRITTEKADEELRKRYKMKGLIRSDAETATMMDGGLIESSGHSQLIPVALKKDGSFYKSSSVADDAQWSTLRDYVRHTIEGIGSAMTSGDVGIEPYRMGMEKACTHCSYKSVCQFDTQFEANEYKLLLPVAKERALELMNERLEAKGELHVVPFRRTKTKQVIDIHEQEDLDIVQSMKQSEVKQVKGGVNDDQ
ncbi:DNA helicase/exodeoxyribonuclease V, subunit B [Paenibacillus sp. 1_12]|uniref:helicase-exonuclease AddAB subunit AddB n=1 Tax=Paenibacillus sp. 1_12 TaxID=1566278 RepID=UPI0008F184DF|nr:helicase-exonuclease AddAB subunit AddB [Paenibacillus sp. 1_12]SFL33079.1 DNA helicase/exodeoxyribonuclease V, subunit B [Paenibacillus sp. 1_12]